MSTSVIGEPSPNNQTSDNNDPSIPINTTTTTTTQLVNLQNVSTVSTTPASSAICSESGGEDSLPPILHNKQSTSSSSSSVTATAAATTTPFTASTLQPTSIEHHCRLLEEENQNLKESQTRLQQQHVESQRRERILMRRLANKEQEIQDYVSQITEYKSAQAPGPAALRSALLDPAVNIMFEKLKNELQTTKAKLEETQNELSAWKFTPDSNTGKRLMAKCRQLYQENEELGKMMSNGRLAKLETELAMQKSFSEEVKKSQSELDDFLQELDEDVEGMQSTIYFLQQELKATRDRIQILEKENHQLKNGISDETEKHNQNFIINGKTSLLTHEVNNELVESLDNDERTKKSNSINYNINNNTNSVIVNSNTSSNLNNNNNNNNNSNNNNNNSNNNNNVNINSNDEIDLRTNGGNEIFINNNGDDSNNEILTMKTTDSLDYCIDNSNNSSSNNYIKCSKPPKKRNYDSDSSENSGSTTNGISTIQNKILNKKARRSSVLSIDLNEEDTQIDEDNDDNEDDNNTQRTLMRRKSLRGLQNINEHN